MKRILLLIALVISIAGCGITETPEPQQRITLHIGESQADVLSNISDKPYSMSTEGNMIIYKWADVYSDCSIGDPTHCNPSRQITFTDGKLTGYSRLWANVSVEP